MKSRRQRVNNSRHVRLQIFTATKIHVFLYPSSARSTETSVSYHITI